MSDTTLPTDGTVSASRSVAEVRAKSHNFTPDDLQHWHKDISVGRSKVTKFARLVLLVIFGFGTIWGATAELGGAIMAKGRVVTENRNREIQYREGGILEEILVREGDTVEAGQIVARLNTYDDRTQLAGMKVQQAIIRIQLARRVAGVAGYPEMIIPADIDEDVLAHPRVQETIVSQRSEFAAAQDFIQGQIRQLEIQVENLTKENGAQRDIITTLSKQEEIGLETVAGLEVLFEQGNTDLSRLNNEKRILANTQERLKQTEARIYQNEGRIREAENEKTQVRLRLLQESEDESIGLQAQLNDVSQTIDRLTDRIRRADLVSPVAGQVHQILRRTVGATLRPGETILEIFPEQDSLVLEVELDPADKPKVFVGQSARLQFGNLFSNVPIEGEVTIVGEDVVTPPNPQQPPYILAYVSVDIANAPEEWGDVTTKFFPGNKGQVFLKSESKTFFEILAAPFSRADETIFTE